MRRSVLLAGVAIIVVWIALDYLFISSSCSSLPAWAVSAFGSGFACELSNFFASYSVIALIVGFIVAGVGARLESGHSPIETSPGENNTDSNRIARQFDLWRT